ncbi:hypothetical protein PV08_08627 [Exophiala spinifera]|uniref:Major facilitator superfamily (MFS) profile domain-containing protein n=1 Tax=Exophiala spinifera TaxID=91928 RepID=A0A0D2BQN1_9EURO|nr:uncharacterized protein PV08_08627 [Exophiala spinifera]KIW13439.1 hypothetical protein PV08_08627 [Exophiala spinifera]
MNNVSTRNDRRRASSERRRHHDDTARHEDFDARPSLMLTRTRSQEFSMTESIAIQETLPPERPKHTQDGAEDSEHVWPHSVRYLVLLCAFITSLSFGVTQVPLLYVFRLMTCDAYYTDHSAPPPSSSVSPSASHSHIISILAYTFDNPGKETPDRCSVPAIESSTALSVALLGASTTIFGLLNLFVTGSLIKRIGVKPTLVIQVFFPALRLLVQTIGVEVWGSTGIIIIQCSQIVSILGGPSGYLLALNTFITEVVEYEGRTAALGRLTGAMMFGSATGFLVGGVVAETFGVKAPFRLTFLLFMSACAYVVVFLPHLHPDARESSQPQSKKGKESANTGLKRFFGPLGVFAPRKFVGLDGVVRTEYGAFLLAWGVFLGILATGYLPTLLQLYATDVFAFGTQQNGWLIFMYSMLRGVFLTFAFPKAISLGRAFTIAREARIRKRNNTAGHAELNGHAATERDPLLSRPRNDDDDSDTTKQVDTDRTDHDQDEDVKGNGHIKDTTQSKRQETFTFDLTYTRGSLIADGLLTLLCSFVREGWQMYLVAAVLPFAAGTGSASKGTILQMVGSGASSAERTDALAGVSLVENMARLSTTFVFGLIFAGFTSIGRTELVFTVNAAVAIVGFVVLLFARFPLEGSVPIDSIEQDEDDEEEEEDDDEDQ